MRSALFLFSFTVIVSCKNPKLESLELHHESKGDNYQGLLAKFKNINFDTLLVSSPSFEDENDPFMGKELDSSEAMLFPPDIFQEYFTSRYGLYAIYKFRLAHDRLGLIARTPSFYDASSIKLFFFDEAKDSITSYLELAESYGDAGDYMVKTSWLYKDKADNTRSFMRVLNGYDHSVGNAMDSTVEHWFSYYLLDLSKIKIDTLQSKFDYVVQKNSADTRD